MAEETTERSIGRYRVLGELGRGGMAVVFRAFDPQLKREVAVKVVRTDPSVYGGDTIERFQRELKSMAMVTHPNVIRIFDGGSAGSQPFLVTELIEGRTLEQILLKEKRQPIATALEWTASLLEALQAVHEAGLVHRDIKPSNLMVTAQGRLVLMDFGIAKAAFNETMTRTGDVPGTLAYLPPECLAGQKATVPSDLFQVALTSYEMLVGKPLFVLKSPKDFLQAHGALPPKDVAARREGLSPAVAEVLQRALEPDPKDRYASAAQMLDALRHPSRASRRVKAAMPLPARPAAAPATKPSWLLPAAGLGGFALAGVAALMLWGAGSVTAPESIEVQVTREALEVSWQGGSYQGAVEVTAPPAGSFIAEEAAATRSHRVRIPGHFEGLELTLRAGPLGGPWSKPVAVPTGR